MDIILVLVGGVIGVGLLYIALFNSLVALRQKVRESWSGISVQLKRRYDLIPNVVAAVQGYASHEQQVLQKVTEARAAAIAVPEGKVSEQSEAENMLSGTLKSLFAISENYPQLRASDTFLQLQTELSETEDQIAASRRIYNGNVSLFNTQRESFPSNIVASLHHFAPADFFIAEEEQNVLETAPKVQF